MDEKDESSPREQEGTVTPTSDETESEDLEETLRSITGSTVTGSDPTINRKSEETDTFTSLSDEETEALDSTRESETDTFHDPVTDWDDDEILEDSGRRKHKRWVVTGTIAVVTALSLMFWWLFFLKDPPYPLPDFFEALKRKFATHAGGEPSVAVFKVKAKIKKRKNIRTAGAGTPAQFQEEKHGEPSNDFSIERPFDAMIRGKSSQAATLRGELLKKHKEIQNLQHVYRERIDAVEKTILDEKRKANVTTFKNAVKIKSIEYGLRTIHRRNVYINNLNAPLNQLNFAAEELLYFERLADIQLKMADVTEGIDMGILIKKMDRAIRKHRDGLTRLTIQRKDPPPPDLERIWKDVLRKREKKSAHRKKRDEKKSPQMQTQINHEILAEIQRGELSRKKQLTWLSQEGAIALSKWPGKVLFLNKLSVLPPLTAEKLARWQGDWLCLNGLRELSSETARSLSRWPGKRLSLNGLKSISREAAQALSNWQGTELEMAGITEAAPETVSLLRNWGTFGKKVYFGGNLK